VYSWFSHNRYDIDGWMDVLFCFGCFLLFRFEFFVMRGALPVRKVI
jgi:hypothetical protein